MKNKIKKKGKYKLYSTTNDNTILSLKGSKTYAVASGQKGDILARSNGDHKKKKTHQKGKYYLVDFKDDPDFQDMQHLFLKKGSGKYTEWILPNSLPTKKKKQVKLIKSGTVKASKLKDHMKNRGTKRRDLTSMKKEELYRLAKKNKIRGRSKMSKKELSNKLEKKI